MAILLTRKTPIKVKVEEKNEETINQLKEEVEELKDANKTLSDSLLFTIMRGSIYYDRILSKSNN